MAKPKAKKTTKKKVAKAPVAKKKEKEEIINFL